MGLCLYMFYKRSMKLMGQLTTTSEDYKVLENMSKLISLEYLEIKDIVINISKNIKDLNQIFAAHQPNLNQITFTEEQVAAHEQATYRLNA
ncbi:biogenesis of lysosome-related organelles complex 1 subunit 2-like [Macrotis lagotis]|uniref:biogenesis of lysosome-related organelles complex 1 subunit 2-like n=1 Tax=Macrotis lagotis TaxID=92651 RepID=UPI003D69CD30